MEFKENLPPLDPDEFQVFEGEAAYFVLKEVCSHLKLRKFLGPWEKNVLSFRGRPMRFSPLFTIPKTDDFVGGIRKHRVIFNAAAPHKLSKRQQNILDRRFDSSEDFQIFSQEPFIKTLNENIQNVGIRLDLVKTVIEGLYKCKLL